MNDRKEIIVCGYSGSEYAQISVLKYYFNSLRVLAEWNIYGLSW